MSGVEGSEGLGLLLVMGWVKKGKVRRHRWLSCHQVQVVWADEHSQVRVVWDDAESGVLPQSVFAEVPCAQRACRQAWRSVQETEQGKCMELLDV